MPAQTFLTVDLVPVPVQKPKSSPRNPVDFLAAGVLPAAAPSFPFFDVSDTCASALPVPGLPPSDFGFPVPLFPQNLHTGLVHFQNGRCRLFSFFSSGQSQS